MKCQKKSEKCPSEVPRVQEVMSSNCTNSSKPKDINLAQVNETKQNTQTNKQTKNKTAANPHIGN